MYDLPPVIFMTGSLVGSGGLSGLFVTKSSGTTIAPPETVICVLACSTSFLTCMLGCFASTLLDDGIDHEWLGVSGFIDTAGTEIECVSEISLASSPKSK